MGVVLLPDPFWGAFRGWESSDLRPPGMGEPPGPLLVAPRRRHPLPTNTTRLTPLPTPGSRTHYLQIFIAPSPSQDPSSALGSAVQRAGAPLPPL